MDKTLERNKPLGDTSSGLAALGAVVGSTVGNGQCYAVPAYYVLHVTDRPHLCAGVPGACPISDATGADTVAASNIGYAYRWNDFGWTVIENPTAQDLRVGGIVTWKPYRDVAITQYGHVAVIEGIDGATISTIEQNAESGQVVARYTRSWKSDIFQHIIYKEGDDMATPEEIWNELLDNGTAKLPARRFITSIDAYTRDQPARIWAEKLKTGRGEVLPAGDLLKWIDKNSISVLTKLEENNGLLQSIAEKVIDNESLFEDIKRQAKEGAQQAVSKEVRKAMDVTRQL